MLARQAISHRASLWAPEIPFNVVPFQSFMVHFTAVQSITNVTPKATDPHGKHLCVHVCHTEDKRSPANVKGLTDSC